MAVRRKFFIQTGGGSGTGGGGGSAGVPLYIAQGETYTVPENRQVLFTEEIELDGDLELDGILVEVN